MDLTRTILYRGFTLNDPETENSFSGGGALDTGIAGCVVDSVDMSDVDVVQFLEKRSQADGMDAGDVEFGTRRIRMAGTLYGKNRADLYDRMMNLRAALNPVLAQREEPLDKGYRPLFFGWPTARTDDYPPAVGETYGLIELQVKALPRANQLIFDRDRSGGSDPDALAIPWQATLLCRDPGIYSAVPVDVALTIPTEVTSGVTSVAATDLFTKASHGLVAGDRITFRSLTGGTGLSTGVAYWVISSGLTANDFKISATSGGASVDHTSDVTAATYVKSTTNAGTWSNRGTYLGKFNAVIEVGAGAGSIACTVGDSTFTVTVPASTGNRIIRIKDDKIITFEEENEETPQMGRITFSGDTTWPLIPAGDSAYSVTVHGCGGAKDGSHFWFYEQYA